MKILDSVALILIVLGAVNWGLMGFFQFNLVDTLFGTMNAFSRILYAVIGVAGLYSLSFFAKDKFMNSN